MNFANLFELQSELDAHIEQEHPRLKRESRLNKKVIAFLVELSEMLNEKRSTFKFWSTKKDDNEKALIEYVDGIHFLLSIGLEIGSTMNLAQPYILDYEDLEVQILEIFQSASLIREFGYEEYERTFELYLGLGEMLGFSWKQVEQAYYAKNEVNHARQDRGY